MIGDYNTTDETVVPDIFSFNACAARPPRGTGVFFYVLSSRDLL
jgi:hypothetical protein